MVTKKVFKLYFNEKHFKRYCINQFKKETFRGKKETFRGSINQLYSYSITYLKKFNNDINAKLRLKTTQLYIHFLKYSIAPVWQHLCELLLSELFLLTRAVLHTEN